METFLLAVGHSTQRPLEGLHVTHLRSVNNTVGQVLVQTYFISTLKSLGFIDNCLNGAYR